MPSNPQAQFAELVAIMHRLRAPGGCPWDREQTHESLRPYLVEEAYEVLDAMELGNDDEFRDELGDLLLQVVFHAELASERSAFTIDDVVAGICTKLIRRHPHVFADKEFDSAAEVAANWSRIKAEEREERRDVSSAPPSALDGIPRALPTLIRGHRIGEKAAHVGFDWSSAAEVKDKILEELAEAEEAAGDPVRHGEELGDLLFAVINYIRLSGNNSETVLERTLDRFSRRFRKMEDEFRSKGVDIHSAAPAELNAAWERAKSAAADGRR